MDPFLKFQNLGQGESFLSELMPQLEWLAIQTEILIGLWLVSGWWEKLSRIALLALLAIFFGASLAMVIQGRSTCGCLGAASVSPVWMLVFDLASVLVVSLSSASGQEADSNSLGAIDIQRDGRWLFGRLGLTVVLAASFGAMSVGLAPAIASTLSFVGNRSQSLRFEPSVIDAGQGEAGQWKAISVRLENKSNEPIRLIGGKENCNCKTIRALPLTVQPNGHEAFEILVKLGATSGLQSGSFWLLTDNQNQRSVHGTWKGTVVHDHESSDSDSRD